MVMGAAGNSACNDTNIFTLKFVEAHHYSLLVGIEGDNHCLHAYIQSVVLVENGALYRTALTHFNGWKTKILSLRLRYELISKRLNYQSKYTNTSGRAHANPFNWKCRCKFWQFLGPRLCLLLEVSCDDELPRRSVLL